MTMLLKKYANTVLIIITVPLILFLSLIPAVSTTSDRLHCVLVSMLLLQTPFYSQLKAKVDNILTKDTTLRIKLNIDVDPIARSLPLGVYPTHHGVSPHTHINHCPLSCCQPSLQTPIPINHASIFLLFHLLFSPFYLDPWFTLILRSSDLPQPFLHIPP